MPAIASRPTFEYQGHTYSTLLSNERYLLTKSSDENLFILFQRNPLLPVVLLPDYAPITQPQAVSLYNQIVKSNTILGI